MQSLSKVFRSALSQYSSAIMTGTTLGKEEAQVVLFLRRQVDRLTGVNTHQTSLEVRREQAQFFEPTSSLPVACILPLQECPR